MACAPSADSDQSEPMCQSLNLCLEIVFKYLTRFWNNIKLPYYWFIFTFYVFMGEIMTLSLPTMWQFPVFYLIFLPQRSYKQTFLTRTLLFPYFPKSPIRLIGMSGEAYLPSNAYFPWVPDYTPLILDPCLSVWKFIILPLCISTLWFSEIMILVCWPQIRLTDYDK